MFIYDSSNIRHLTHTLGFCFCIYLLNIFFLHQIQYSRGKVFSYACDIFIGRNLAGESERGIVQIKSVAQESTELWRGKAHQKRVFCHWVGVKDMGREIINQQEFHVTQWPLWGLFCRLGFYSLWTCCLNIRMVRSLFPLRLTATSTKGHHNMTLVHFASSDL